MPSRETSKTLSAWVAIIAAAVCLFVGWGWVLQGYEEDAGVTPIQSWPFGVGGYLAGGVLVLVAIRRVRPRITASSLTTIAILIVFALVAAAFGASDAGQQ